MKPTFQISFIAFALVIASPGAKGSAIDTTTLVPSGLNTIFTITGTYPTGVPTTLFSTPNTAYSLTFTLPTTPTALAFADDVFGIFAVDASVTVNGITIPGSQVAFFDGTLGGGLDVCLQEECSPEPPTKYVRFATFGDTLFTGSVFNPTFISGSAFVAPGSFIESPVPEPSTLALFGAAIVALSAYKINGGIKLRSVK